MTRYLRASLGGLLLGAAAGGFAAEPTRDVNVVGDMTEAGHKLAPVSREHPVYYAPLVIGYRAEGAVMAGEKPPAKEETLHHLAKALAERGYYVCGAGKPEPSLLLIFSWGSLNPSFDTIETAVSKEESEKDDGETTSVDVVANSREMLALVAGNTVRNIQPTPPWVRNEKLDDVRSDMRDDRYFVTVVAFDWAAAKEHKKQMLWSTKISVPSRGVSMAEVVPALIKAGTPFLGRETAEPQHINVPAVREGRVEIGVPTTVDKNAAPPQNGEKK